MLHFLTTSLIVFWCAMNYSANAEVFSLQEINEIEAFPAASDSLNLTELAARGVHEDTTAREAFVGAIVALRLGENETARLHSQRMSSIAIAPEDRTRAQFLENFLALYLGSNSDLGADTEQVLGDLASYNEASMEIDWLAGTAATILLEQALKTSHAELAQAVVDEMSLALSSREDIEAAIWQIDAYLKAAYAAGQSEEGVIDPFSLLFDGVEVVDRASAIPNNDEHWGTLELLYLRLHTTFGVIQSRRAYRNHSFPVQSLPMLRAFHPKFQFECVFEVNEGKTRFRTRREYGTGGLMVRLSVDQRGRVRFSEIVDAQPVRLKKKFMHSYLRKWANSMRVSVIDDRPECQNGGEMLLPFTMIWG